MNFFKKVLGKSHRTQNPSVKKTEEEVPAQKTDTEPVSVVTPQSDGSKPTRKTEVKPVSELEPDNRNLKRQIQIHIPKESVQAAFRKSYRDMGKHIKMTGFRPGKAPAEAIRQTRHYNKIREKTIHLLFEEFYEKALKKDRLNPAGDPKILNLHLEENEAGAIQLELEIHPKCVVKNYQNLKLKKRDTQVTQQQIDSALEKLRQDFTQYVPAETNCLDREGLIGIFSITAKHKKGNKKFPPLCLKECAIQMGKNNIAPDFDKNLKNLKVGREKTFDFLFPADHENKDLAGRTLCFQMKLQKIKKRFVSELNDEFAKKLSYNTFSDLKEAIIKQLKANNEKTAEKELRNAVVLELAKQNPLTLPEVLVEQEKTSITQQFAKECAAYKLPPESIKTLLKEKQTEIEQSAKTNVHVSYLLQALARDLKIQISEKMQEEYLKHLSPHLSRQQIQHRLKDRNVQESINSRLIAQKTIDHLMTQAEVL